MSSGPTYSYRTSRGGEGTAVQLALRRQGYYRGPIDGSIGPASQRAIRSFQRDNDLPVTGTVDSNLLQALRVRT
jgi:peptidoglycan hydrolase-like protein with peptidoglycan-binding domain